MRISLVTTVKNEAQTARRLVDGVAGQSRPPDEWIVVDGGSTDRTVACFSGVAGCRVLEATCNIAKGRNLAIESSRGEIIAVTDGGCVPERHWLERLSEPVEQGRAEIVAGSTRPRIRHPFDATQWVLLDQFSSRLTGRRPAVSARSLALRRPVWEEEPFPEWLDFGEDTWAVRRWRHRGRILERAPQAVVDWELRPDWKSFVRQHFRYMWGDGRAGLHPGRHAVRFAFYGALGALLFAGPAERLAAAGLMGVYGAATAVRLPEAVRGKSALFGLAVLLLLVPSLPSMDAAKMVGYVAGSYRRLRARGSS